jgi:ubiquinone biosynthesis protein COQ4
MSVSGIGTSSVQNSTLSGFVIMITTLPLLHPDRVRPRFRPFRALGHFRKLMADKEDTAQVFHIFDCLPRRDYVPNAAALMDSPAGQQLMTQEPCLPDVLDDHPTLRRLPEGSVGRAYVDFMTREGLSAAGLVAESARMGRVPFADRLQWYIDRQRDTHDLLHVLTGYGRDALGEQCVLAYTYGQQPSLGNVFIAWLGALEIKRTVKSHAPVLGAVREAQTMGRGAPRLIAQDIRALLAEPLDAVRARMGIHPTPTYAAAHAAFREVGVNPYDLLGQGKTTPAANEPLQQAA